MLYVYYGTDQGSARTKVQATVARMLSKNPDALYFRVTTDTLASYHIDELLHSQGLFKSEYIIVLDSLCATTEGEQWVRDALPQLTETTHPVFLVEGALRAPLKKKLEATAHTMQDFTLAAPRTSASFNTFALTDALAQRDVKQLWVLFREAKQHGVSDEEIHGILFWMLKSISLASQSSSASVAGMKEYPFKKAKQAVRNFSEKGVLQHIITEWALLPQKTRRSGGVLEYELEKCILTLASDTRC